MYAQNKPHTKDKFIIFTRDVCHCDGGGDGVCDL